MGTPASDLLAAALRQHVAALASAEADLVAGGSEAVHDARVATRRLRAVLGEFPRLVDDDVAADLRERLQSWGRLLSDARDLEVVLGMLDDDASISADVRARARAAWGERLEAARATAVEHLATAEHARLVADLATAAADPPLTDKAARPWQDELPRGTRRAARRVERRERRAAEEGADPATVGMELLHAVRKAVRRARYANEVLALGSGQMADDAAREADRLAERQESLGAAIDEALLHRALAELTPDD